MDGILNIYKEKGYTSHDVVAIIRKKLNIKKVGHTGTLDPEAEGVLPICIGKATKVSSILIDANKSYRTTLSLGIETDTGDHTGKIISQCTPNVSTKEIKMTILSFVGDYIQTPPMYSAIRVNGKRLYELAREGKIVERNSRKVKILDIDILSINNNEIDMIVDCSKGTYIRTLCEDIGKKLLCGGHMSSLIRLKASFFNIKDSIKLAELDRYITNNKMDDLLIKIDSLFLDLPKLLIDKKHNKYLYNGNKLEIDFVLEDKIINENEQYRVYDESSKFIGLYEGQMTKKLQLKPFKLFL